MMIDIMKRINIEPFHKIPNALQIERISEIQALRSNSIAESMIVKTAKRKAASRKATKAPRKKAATKATNDAMKFLAAMTPEQRAAFIAAATTKG